MYETTATEAGAPLEKHGPVVIVHSPPTRITYLMISVSISDGWLQDSPSFLLECAAAVAHWGLPVHTYRSYCFYYSVVDSYWFVYASSWRFTRGSS